MGEINKREIGHEKEQIAAKFLEKQGCKLVTCNFYCKLGEIDLIVKDQEYFVFVEVKYRAEANKGYPQEAVTFPKRKKIIKTAQYYLLIHSYALETPCRFDVIAILADEITWIKNAFDI